MSDVKVTTVHICRMIVNDDPDEYFDAYSINSMEPVGIMTTGETYDQMAMAFGHRRRIYTSTQQAVLNNAGTGGVFVEPLYISPKDIVFCNGATYRTTKPFMLKEFPGTEKDKKVLADWKVWQKEQRENEQKKQKLLERFTPEERKLLGV